MDASFTAATALELPVVMAHVNQLLSPTANPLLQSLEQVEQWLSYNQTSALSRVTTASYFEMYSVKLELLVQSQEYLAEEAISAVTPIRVSAIIMMVVYSVILGLAITVAVFAMLWLRLEIEQLAQAEHIAECVCEMALEDIPPSPKSPSPMQQLMFQIAEKMRSYRAYLPDSLFSSQQNDADEIH
eukprot:RCo040909